MQAGLRARRVACEQCSVQSVQRASSVVCKQYCVQAVKSASSVCLCVGVDMKQYERV